MSSREPCYRAGNARIFPQRRQIFVGDRSVKIGGRAFDLLLLMVERRGALVTKKEIFDAVWPASKVEDGNIAAQIGSLRKILGADSIATIAGRGYRFARMIEAENERAVKVFSSGASGSSASGMDSK